MTDETKCPICARRSPAYGLVICEPCRARIDDDLARILELTRMAAGQIAPGQGNGGAGTQDGTPLAIATDFFDVATGIEALELLESWERLTREHFGLSPYGQATRLRNRTDRTDEALRTCIAFLRAQLALIAEAPDYPVEDMAREVREQVVRYSWVDPDRPGAEGSARLKCPSDHPDADGRLCHARITWDRDRPNDDILCPRCRTVWTGARLLLLALHDESQQMWMYPAEIEGMLGIGKRTLQRWGRDGLVARRGTQYDVGAAYRLRLRVSA
jgi:hypothetical protein